MHTLFNQTCREKNCLKFSFELKCYPVSFIEKAELEKGDKILLPPSILENFSDMEIKWPLMFELYCFSSKRKTHCGVMEFTADEGCAYLPYWMMQNIGINEGEKIQFKYVNLEKGTFVKIQPQTMDFFYFSNTKAVLEAKLRNFTCLTKLDSIAIEYNEKIYWFNVTEVKPGNAISIVETDVDIDFINPDMNNSVESSNKLMNSNSKDKNENKTWDKEESSSESE